MSEESKPLEGKLQRESRDVSTAVAVTSSEGISLKLAAAVIYNNYSSAFCSAQMKTYLTRNYASVHARILRGYYSILTITATLDNYFSWRSRSGAAAGGI